MAASQTLPVRICGRCQAALGKASVTYKGVLLCEPCFRLSLFGGASTRGEAPARQEEENETKQAFEWTFHQTTMTVAELLRNDCRAQVDVNGRKLAVFCSTDGNQVFCCDDRCYHAGGSLADGDIEDTGSSAFGHIVICPWHGYRISLKTGEGLSRNRADCSSSEDGTYQSKGAKQRIHRVEVRDDGFLYVALSDLSTEISSDVYYPQDRN